MKIRFGRFSTSNFDALLIMKPVTMTTETHTTQPLNSRMTIMIRFLSATQY